MDVDGGVVAKYQGLLAEALSSDPHAALAHCEAFELEHAGNIDTAVAVPFYRVQLISYLLGDLVNARWLWERLPEAAKADEELKRIWEVVKLLWNQNLADAYRQLLGTSWTDPAVRTIVVLLLEDLRGSKLQLIANSHSSIGVAYCAQMMGLSEDETVTRCKKEGWEVEGGFLKPCKSAAGGGSMINSEQLQALTDYVCALDTQ